MCWRADKGVRPYRACGLRHPRKGRHAGRPPQNAQGRRYLRRGRPLSARYASSPEGQPAAAKREAIPCDNHPDKVGTPAMGRQLGKSQKAQACPKAGQNRRLHRYVDLRQRGGPLHRSAPHTFLFRPCTAHFSFGKTERGPRRAPNGRKRRSKGAGAVFAAGGNGAERTLRRRQWGAHPPWKRPPAGAESPVAAVRRPKSSPGG